MSQCHNCGTAYKSGMFGAVTVMTPERIAIINEYSEDKKESYCNKCGGDLFLESSKKCQKEIHQFRTFIMKNMECMPIFTIENPQGWNFKAIEMVTAQSVTGTGVLSEMSASFNDLFGGRSNTLSAKLKGGEDFCKAQLRIMALDLDCHAIVGIDIDYSEVGSLRGMMMVCMAGTAIKLENTSVVENANFQKLLEVNQRLKYLDSLNNKL